MAFHPIEKEWPGLALPWPFSLHRRCHLHMPEWQGTYFVWLNISQGTCLFLSQQVKEKNVSSFLNPQSGPCFLMSHLVRVKWAFISHHLQFMSHHSQYVKPALIWVLHVNKIDSSSSLSIQTSLSLPCQYNGVWLYLFKTSNTDFSMSSQPSLVSPCQDS